MNNFKEVDSILIKQIPLHIFFNASRKKIFSQNMTRGTTYDAKLANSILQAIIPDVDLHIREKEKLGMFDIQF